MDDLIRLSKEAMLGGGNPYRAYYFAHPEYYAQPIRGWAEFRARFGMPEEAGVLPEAPPTIMEAELQDQHFFADAEDEVTYIVNVNDCPPFLHRLAFIKVVYVLRGSGYFLMNGQVTELRQGSFVLVGPNVEQAVYSCHDEDIVLNLLIRLSAFSASFMNLMTLENGMSEYMWRMVYNRATNNALLYCGAEEPVLRDTVLELYREMTQPGRKSNLICKSLLMIFFGNTLRLHMSDLVILQKAGKHGSYRLPQFLYSMKSRLSCTLPELSGHFGLSEGCLSRYLRRETGRTFSELMCELRMRQAASMLDNTDFSIDMIAESVGYADKSRFYRNFSRMYGMTPKHYRNRRMIL